MGTRGGFLRTLGPGLLFAAAAIGVSHLVQSTRAGAEFGLAMLPFVVLGLASKYPALRLGQHYTITTGMSLLEGFRRQGRWALVLYALLTLAVMFSALAAIALVSAGLVKTVFGLERPVPSIATLIIVIAAPLVALGQYHWLDRVIKLMMVVLAVCTLAATALALPRLDWSDAGRLWSVSADLPTLVFIAALVGWMPAPLDTAVWHSLWALARIRDARYRPSLAENRLDFHIGFLGSGVLAGCFLLLGAAVMFGAGVPFADGAAPFAAQVIALYEQTLGAWSRPLISAAALAVMFSTVLTVIDGFPRALACLAARLRSGELPGGFEVPQYPRGYYLAGMVLMCGGALAVLHLLLGSFRLMIDVATTISFITAPLLAWLIHRAAWSVEVPAALRPGAGLRVYSIACIGALSLFAVAYLYLVLFTGA